MFYQEKEVKGTLKFMGIDKVVGPNQTLFEVAQSCINHHDSSQHHQIVGEIDWVYVATKTNVRETQFGLMQGGRRSRCRVEVW